MKRLPIYGPTAHVQIVCVDCVYLAEKFIGDSWIEACTKVEPARAVGFSMATPDWCPYLEDLKGTA